MASFLYPALAALLGQQQQPSGPTARDALGLAPSQGPLPLQQMLAQPGPSRPTWMAPVMEHQQLLATSMDPAISAQQRQAANEAFNRQMFGVAMATGPGVTKEQKAAWEAENEAFRARQPTASPQPGQRVKFYPSASFGGEGTVVMPGSPEAGKPGPVPGGEDPNTPPGADWVAVRPSDSPYWSWRHRNELEMLPPKQEFKVGDAVRQDPLPEQTPGTEWEGIVSEPPPNARPSPGPDYVWVDVRRSSGGPPDKRGVWRSAPFKTSMRYASGDFGDWFHKSFWTKK